MKNSLLALILVFVVSIFVFKVDQPVVWAAPKPKVCVYLYEHINFGGKVFTRCDLEIWDFSKVRYPNSNMTINDQTSSVKVLCSNINTRRDWRYIALSEHKDGQGNFQVMSCGKEINDLRMYNFNDKASSLEFDPV